jgi:hypothetical protein
MAADEAPRERPRPSLLIALGVAVLALLVYWTWPSATTTAGPSNLARTARGAASATPNAAALDVKLEALKQPPPEPADTGRNPLRFQPKAPPPPPPGATKPVNPLPAAPPGPPPPPPGPPPIPLKFFGVVEGRPGKIAALTDGRFVFHGREGEVIEGRYRIVKIGVESIVMEYVDGTGRQTIPLRGQ